MFIFFSARIFIPYYTGQVIANIVHRDAQSVSAFYTTVLTMCGFMAVATVFAGLRGASFSWGGALVNRIMRKNLFESLIKQEIAFFDELQTGKITFLVSLSVLFYRCHSLSFNDRLSNCYLHLGSQH